MHSHPGIVAGLATAIIAITAEPAAADPGPILPLPAVEVSIDLVPDSSPTTTTAAATTPTTTAAAPAAAKPKKKTKTKTVSAEPTGTVPTTRETAVRSTNRASSQGGVARQQTAATRSPTPSPSRHRAVLPQVMPQPNDIPNGPPGGGLHELIALLVVALVVVLAAMSGRRPRRCCAADLVENAAGRPEFADPEGVARRRLRSVK